MNQQDSRKWIGQPLDRVDGPAKVTGQATYAADYRGESPAAIGFIVEAGIGKGRIASIDTSVAEASDGVLLVLTHQNAPDQAPFGAMTMPAASASRMLCWRTRTSNTMALRWLSSWPKHWSRRVMPLI